MKTIDPFKQNNRMTFGDRLRSATVPVEDVELSRVQKELYRAAKQGRHSQVVAVSTMSIDQLKQRLDGVELKDLKTEMGLLFVEVTW